MVANRFQEDIERRLARLAATGSSLPITWDAARQEWVQPCDPQGASMPGLLQNLELVADVTDKGLKLMPLLVDGRFYARLELGTGMQPTLVGVGPGRYRVEGDGCRMVARQPESLPAVALDIEVSHAGRALDPSLLWLPEGPPELLDGALWLPARSYPAEDEIVSHNNSELADPRCPSLGGAAGLLLVDPMLHSDHGLVREQVDEQMTIAERSFEPLAVERVRLPVRQLTPGTLPARLWLVVCERDQVERLLTELPAAGRELDRWRSLSRELRVNTGDASLDRLAPFSLHNSLFSRARRHPDRVVFLHGRRDRGYGDCAKPHQSYQMHLPALAAGECGSVRDDLIVHLALQSSDGAVRDTPRPGSGEHPYVAPYSTAHVLLALHRYLSWTGDRGILDAPVEDREGQRRTVLERAGSAGEWLCGCRRSGLVPPCGWLDAWPPGVVGQAQVSMASLLALGRLSDVLAWAGESTSAGRFAAVAAALAERIRNVFHRSDTGLFGEHLLVDGRVIGDQLDDFYTPTQIWAVLAGVAEDPRGLELTRSNCLRPGLQAVPASSFDRAGFLGSTDGFRELEVDSARTWELACWPELTHLYAMAEVRMGRPDHALEAVLASLPETLRRANTAVLPYFCAEKYLTPGLTPWLCTWGGDPTLWEVVLTMLGVRPELGGLGVAPSLPTAWRGTTLSAGFHWRGSRWDLRIDPHEGSPAVHVDGVPQPDGVILPPSAASGRHLIEVS